MKKDIKEYLDDREFYELMQDYRTAPITQQVYVIRAYEYVKSYIIKMVEEMNKPEPKTDIVLYAYTNSLLDECNAFISNAKGFNSAFFSDKKVNIKLTYDGETNELKSAEKI